MSDTEEAETKVIQFDVKEEPAKDETEHELETNKVVEEVKAKKKGRGHRVITDEERERLKAQLAKGRATALENRRKKKLAKQAEKSEKEKEIEDKIIDKVVSKRKAPLDKELNDLKEEIAKLKAEREALKKPRSPSPPPKPPSPVEQEKPKPTPAPQPKPAPVQQEVRREPVAPKPKKVFRTKGKGLPF